MTVTVCIPAYRAAGFIGQTVASVLGQSHADLKLVVAIDPPEDGAPDGTAEALRPFAGDRRLTVLRNSQRLGWAENFNALLPRVDTEFYCLLPHDDLWSPRYLEVLLAALTARPEAVAAYCDIILFGGPSPVRKTVILPPETGRIEALLAFLLQGAEALPWRGVTRSAVLDKIGGFPTDNHRGLVVECEYALSMLAIGPVVHVPQTHYFKRLYGNNVNTATQQRARQSEEARRAGWEEHDRRMRRHLARALSDMRAGAPDQAACGLALEAALLARFRQFVSPCLGGGERARAERALAAGAALSGPRQAQIIPNLAMLLSGHWQAAGDPARAADYARQAWQAGSNLAAALAQARALRDEGRLLEALERAVEAQRMAHLADRSAADALVTTLYRDLGWTQPIAR